MPVVEIRSLPPPDPSRVSVMLTEIAVRGAEKLAIAPHKVWAFFDEVRPDRYAEGAALATARTPATHPPIVTVRALSGRTLEMKRAFLTVVCEAIGRGLGVEPGAVWLHFVEMEKSEVWVGQKFQSEA